ncbi:hypothetical protein VC83_07604 [Pseudogymnoascus destructans]|uniref:RRM domain-containing protein n=1 Tax=Pseudogymnoascus destructans TaxID=655981 RepID=A0A176ZZX6_9PEZI|nr:uncharacterized protein VC83_07604 [Pseudogymnoascus destructans]OAF55579.1 hypothetical protein VC83_07604 [Pseudogymnoascus destructans]
MGPKKKEQQKMSLGAFMTDEKLGSWADEMEDMPVYSRSGYGAEKRTYGSTNTTFGSGNLAGYSVREELPLPDKPPYTVHLGNLSFDATVGDVTDFFADCECTNVRIIEDKLEMKPKGFGYAEFGSREGLIKALALSGSQFQGRNIRVSVADPPKDRDRPDVRELGDWSRKGPLPDLPGRGGNDRRAPERGFASGRTFGDGGSESGGDRRERRDPFPQDDGKVRDLGNWERRGPLSTVPQQERQTSTREGGRSSTVDGPRAEGFKDRRASPAAWGEGRTQDSQDGSRPPRREFQERPVADRAPTAAEQDSQWRTKMKPDAPVAPAATSPLPSRDGSEGPASPAPASAAPVGRPKLNLTKRTVSEAADVASPASATGDAKASPFGAARPIDTAAKEREIEEKRVAALKEKKEADDKSREEKRIAKEAAKGEKTEGETDDGTPTAEIVKKTDGLTLEEESATQDTTDSKPKEAAQQKPADTGAWRRPAAGPKPPRSDVPRGPRGDGPPRGPRNDSNRGPGPRANGGAPPSGAAAEQVAEAPEEDGWSTVSKPKKNQRGGARGI